MTNDDCLKSILPIIYRFSFFVGITSSFFSLGFVCIDGMVWLYVYFFDIILCYYYLSIDQSIFIISLRIVFQQNNNMTS